MSGKSLEEPVFFTVYIKGKDKIKLKRDSVGQDQSDNKRILLYQLKNR